MSNQDGGPATGVTMLDYFANSAEGPDANCAPSTVAACLGWDKPEYPLDDQRAWFLWWRRAEAAWKYEAAAAMIQAREREKEEPA